MILWVCAPCFVLIFTSLMSSNSSISAVICTVELLAVLSESNLDYTIRFEVNFIIFSFYLRSPFIYLLAWFSSSLLNGIQIDSWVNFLFFDFLVLKSSSPTTCLKKRATSSLNFCSISVFQGPSTYICLKLRLNFCS